MNRACLFLALAALLAAPAARAQLVGDKGRQTWSLAGSWRFALDPGDKGVEERWFLRDLEDRVRLPGTTDTNAKGTPTTNRPVAHLARKWAYVGAAWYQTDVDLPKQWIGRHLDLFLERTKTTRVWVDDREVGGEKTLLSAPHVYDLSSAAPGPHRITVRVDNHERGPLGGHAVSEHTQGNWNGLIGRLELISTDPAWIERFQVVPAPDARRVEVRVDLRRLGPAPLEGELRVSMITADALGKPDALAEQPVRLEGTQAWVSVTLAPPEDSPPWDEFSPALHRFTASLEGRVGARVVRDKLQATTGLRAMGRTGTQIAVNGRATFLRGRHDGCVFPLTGHPPMDDESWDRYFRTCRAYGLNHVRFHSWCPPDAAFRAADRAGIYLQPEAPLWGSVTPENVGALGAEAEAILDAYGNHASFALFSLGNELHGDRGLMTGLVARLRARDPRHLYAIGTNPFFNEPMEQPGDDFWPTMRTRNGESGRARASFSHADLPLGHLETGPPGTRNDFRAAREGVALPVIGHETGQFQVFPNFDEIAKYKGVFAARNLEVFRERLDRAGLGPQARDFFRASGALAVLCYREDIESALRTPGWGGFQLLDLQDYPGQGTALVGILDAFLDSKGLIEPAAWREFCAETVPLLRYDRYTWTADERFAADVEVAHYGPADLTNAVVEWILRDGRGRVAAQGQLPPRTLPRGALSAAGSVAVPLAALAAPARVELELALRGTAYRNRFPLWVFPLAAPAAPPPDLLVARAFDQPARDRLAAGGRVLLLPPAASVARGVDGLFMTDFWCYPMFRGICERNKKPPSPGTLGLLMDPAHPALAAFPASEHSDWVWWRLVKSSRSFVLDDLPRELRPIVQVIDNFERNHRLGLVFQARVGAGRLLVCGIDLPALGAHPEARQLMKSLLDYAGSAAFRPETALTVDQVAGLFSSPDGEKK